MAERKHNPKQTVWSANYNKKAYDSILFRVPKGKKEEYQRRATAEGKSLNQWITERVERD